MATRARSSSWLSNWATMSTWLAWISTSSRSSRCGTTNSRRCRRCPGDCWRATLKSPRKSSIRPFTGISWSRARTGQECKKLSKEFRLTRFLSPPSLTRRTLSSWPCNAMWTRNSCSKHCTKCSKESWSSLSTFHSQLSCNFKDMNRGPEPRRSLRILQISKVGRTRTAARSTLRNEKHTKRSGTKTSRAS